MRYRIYNTESNTYDISKKYEKVIKDCFGEIEIREVYNNINDEKPRIEHYVNVKSLEQLEKFANDINNEIIIGYETDDFVYIAEVDKYVFVFKKDLPKIPFIEIYDGYRE